MRSSLCSALLLCIGLRVAVGMPTPATNDMSMKQIESYFYQYGFMGPEMPDPAIAALVDTNMDMAFDYAIRIFQGRYRDFGLEVNGQLDEPTMKLLSRPRCGMKDIMTMEDTGMDMRRKRRYALAGTKWEKYDLTYKVTQYPRDFDLNQQEVDQEIARALQVWEEVTPLHFIRLEPNDYTTELDIEIQFSITGPSRHGDNYPFDGPSGTLAHAFFPWTNKLGGDAHFDEAEKWTIGTTDGYNLFLVAAHEFGHALGLGHSERHEALMAPFYAGYKPNFQLPYDDIAGIQAIYGGPGSRPPTTPAPMSTTSATTPAPTPAPTMKPEGRDICREAAFDAITTLSYYGENKMYGFRGEYYFLINQDGGIAEGYPKRISESWPGLPNDIDAALFWKGSDWEWSEAEGKWVRDFPATFIFKGEHYWRVEDMSVASGPRHVSEWGRNFPTHIDAAMVWKGNGRTYLFKGNQYYRYTENEGIDEGYPRPLSVWRGLPDSVDAAIQNYNGEHVFFKGNKHYIMDDFSLTVLPDYPKHNFDTWFRCNLRRHREGRRNRHHNKNIESSRVNLRNVGRS